MNFYFTVLTFFHILATVVWIGGMVYYTLILTPSMMAIDPPQRGKLMGAIVKRYGMFAWGSIIVLLITGILKTEDFSFSTFAENTYGIMLFIKHVIILVMIVIGVLISFVYGPKLMAPPTGPPGPPSPEFLKTQALIKFLGTFNMFLGIIVLFLTAALRFPV